MTTDTELEAGSTERGALPGAQGSVDRLRAELAAAEAALEAAEQAHRNEQLGRIRIEQDAQIAALEGQLDAALADAARCAADVMPLLAAAQDSIVAATTAQAEAAEANRQIHWLREVQALPEGGGAINPYPPGIPDPIGSLIDRYAVVRSVRELRI